PKAFEAPPQYPGYLQPSTAKPAVAAAATSAVQSLGTIPAGADLELLVRAITEQVLAAMGQK
ncbi:MAG: class II aldolase/adducin family protein, partial [Planctomycetaceae bacterium]